MHHLFFISLHFLFKDYYFHIIDAFRLITFHLKNSYDLWIQLKELTFHLDQIKFN